MAPTKRMAAANGFANGLPGFARIRGHRLDRPLDETAGGRMHQYELSVIFDDF
jgi:hypothetical protein